MSDISTSTIIDNLWRWFRTANDHDAIKDVTKTNTKIDCYVDSHVSDPISFSVFELSDKGELQINNVTKLMESKAAYFLFVNVKTGWIVAVRNTPENTAKLFKNEKIQNFKIKIIE
ncbi:MAG: hypothetical protein GX568_09855 [Candidatus Gastranaerophilales bacterium]|jgi:hypothetical protein|nr:hypothetical protein [Candidatus Gastranaerophilales bacterium]